MAWTDFVDQDDIATATPLAVSGAAGAVGTATKFGREDHRHAFTPSTDLGMAGFKLTNLGAPTAAADAATKSYADSVATGIMDWKASVRAATAAAPAAYTRVTNVITFTAVGAQVVDGITVALDERLLLKNGAAGADNGIYTVTTKGTGAVVEVWTRATDADASAEVTPGLGVFVEEGTANADAAFVLTTDAPITLNTTALTFTQFSGAGQITAGLGLTKSGNTLDVQVDGASIEIPADTLQVKALGITNAMLAGSIALSKLATDPLARANHTGTQTASTISDLAAVVQAYTLNVFAVPVAAMNFNLQQMGSMVLEQFTTAGRPAAAANKRVIYNTTTLRAQIDK